MPPSDVASPIELDQASVAADKDFGDGHVAMLRVEPLPYNGAASARFLTKRLRAVHGQQAVLPHQAHLLDPDEALHAQSIGAQPREQAAEQRARRRDVVGRPVGCVREGEFVGGEGE